MIEENKNQAKKELRVTDEMQNKLIKAIQREIDDNLLGTIGFGFLTTLFLVVTILAISPPDGTGTDYMFLLIGILLLFFSGFIFYGKISFYFDKKKKLKLAKESIKNCEKIIKEEHPSWLFYLPETIYYKSSHNCRECDSNKWWAIDNSLEFREICSNCHGQIVHRKKDYIDNFKCKSCGCTEGLLSENEQKIKMTCSDCNESTIVFTKPPISINYCDYANSNNETIEKEIEEDHKRAEQIRRNYESQESLKPKCPTCGSTNLERISDTKKVAGALMFGLLSKTARSQFRCRNCGYKW